MWIAHQFLYNSEISQNLMNTNSRNKRMHGSSRGGDDKINKQTKLNIDVIR